MTSSGSEKNPALGGICRSVSLARYGFDYQQDVTRYFGDCLLCIGFRINGRDRLDLPLSVRGQIGHALIAYALLVHALFPQIVQCGSSAPSWLSPWRLHPPKNSALA